jgi:hypothetical protein
VGRLTGANPPWLCGDFANGLSHRGNIVPATYVATTTGSTNVDAGTNFAIN